MSNDYIPTKDEDFNLWAENVMAQLADKASAWNIPAAQVTALNAAFGIWSDAWTAYLAPNHGKIDTQRKKAVRKTTEAELRVFIKAYLLYSPAVTDEERGILGIPLHDTIRTSSTAPETKPEAKVTLDIRRASFYFRDEGSERRGKPKGVRCLELRGIFSATKPPNVESFTKTYTASKSPLVVTCTEEQRGGTFWYVMRWEGATPELKGPWSEIFSVIIP